MNQETKQHLTSIVADHLYRYHSFVKSQEAKTALEFENGANDMMRNDVVFTRCVTRCVEKLMAGFELQEQIYKI